MFPWLEKNSTIVLQTVGFVCMLSILGAQLYSIYQKDKKRCSLPTEYIGPKYYIMPENAEAYKRTKTFTNSTIPTALQNNHNTAKEVWGIIHVLKGKLEYIVSPDNNCKDEQHFTICAGEFGIIKPQALHRVAQVKANADEEIEVEFFVEFCRIPKVGNKTQPNEITSNPLASGDISSEKKID